MSVVAHSSPLNGEMVAELCDNAHLRIRVRKPFGKPLRFSVDVACIDPQLPAELPRSVPTLALATLAAAGSALLALYALWTEMGHAQPLWQALALLALPSTIALALMLRASMHRHVIIRTRCARLPLLTIPLRQTRGDLELFLALLRLHANEAETKRHLTAERFRSGEIKTLRRLAREGVITRRTYERAKSAILRS